MQPAHARAAPEPVPAQTLFCSFCLRHEEEVAKLVAGRGGIYICDACVAACTEWMDKGHSSRSSPASIAETPTGRLLRILRPIQATVEGKSSQLQSAVDMLRARNVSWARIGEALGVSRQAACERFSRR